MTTAIDPQPPHRPEAEAPAFSATIKPPASASSSSSPPSTPPLSYAALALVVGVVSLGLVIGGALIAQGTAKGEQAERIRVVERAVIDHAEAINTGGARTARVETRASVIEARLSNMDKKLDELGSDMKALLRHTGAK